MLHTKRRGFIQYRASFDGLCSSVSAIVKLRSTIRVDHVERKVVAIIEYAIRFILYSPYECVSYNSAHEGWYIQESPNGCASAGAAPQGSPLRPK